MNEASATPAVKAVLFLSHQLHLGGVATHMHALGRGLIERGVKVGVVAREMNDGAQFGRAYFESAGITPIQCDFFAYGLSPANVRKTITSVKRLRSICRDFGADVLHVHAPTLCLAARGTGLPYLTTFNIAVTGRNKIRVARAVNKLTGTAFGQFSIAISNELKKNLTDDLRIPAERVRRATYTIDDDAFSPATPDERTAARRQFGLDDEDFVVCMVASLEERKNHPLLLDAMAALPAGTRPIKAILAGSGWGDHVPNLLKGIADRGLNGRVLYLGQQPARPVYHASDAYVLPSFQEGFPLSTVEAMLSRVVPIRTPSEGAAEQIIDGQTGFIVPFGEPAVLAQRLRRLADDDSHCQTMADATLADARQRFSRQRMADEILALYATAARRG
ncbi:MAG: glycosyltransferase family 4 protein [Tepidisphaeraceae bacterium]